MKDKLGDKLKLQEQLEAGRILDKHKPVMCRLDGRAFHTFTSGLKRPYDSRFSNLMIETTKFLVESTHAQLAYTQSDEITLFWNLDLQANPNAELLFGGKIQKLVSITAGLASSFFSKNCSTFILEKQDAYPVFDSRVWNVADLNEVIENFIWRQDDAIKNSISMAAQMYFSNNQLKNKSSNDKKAMLIDVGDPWENKPQSFKIGTFVKRQKVLIEPRDLIDIPEQFRPYNPIIRHKVQELDVGYLKKLDIDEIVCNLLN